MTSVMPRKTRKSAASAASSSPEVITAADAQRIADDLKAKLDEVRPAVNRLIDKARAFIVLGHPFFSSIMLKRPFVETLAVPTLAVTDSGKIYYNPFFLEGLSVDEMVFAICHEVLHYASGHGPRRGARDPKLWNWAGDAWINSILDVSGVGKRIQGTVFVPGSELKTVEQIYDEIPPKDKDGKGGGQVPGQTDGPGPHEFGEGDQPLEGDVKPDDGEGAPSKEEIEAQRKLDVAEAGQVAKMRGKMPGVLADFVSATIDSKVPWHSILERFMTERVAQDYSWQRPNRRYMPDFYLPSIDGVGAMGEVVCQVDISGSVSPKEIEHYNGHMKRIVEQCRPTKIHVIYTDTSVQKHEVFDRPEDVEIRFYSGGGTDMRAGVAYVAEQGIVPAVMVTLTDGYTPWCEEEPGFPTVWCISTDMKSPVGENVHFSLND